MSIFDTLTDLALFKGISHETMAKAVGKFKFEFKKFYAGEVIVEKDEQCRALTLLISGNASAAIELSNGLKFVQTLPVGSAIFPDFLFGRTTANPGTVVAVDQCSVLQIYKSDYLMMLDIDPVFKFNFMNLICLKGQKCFESVASLCCASLAARLALLVEFLSEPGARNIEISSIKPIHSILGVFEKIYAVEMTELKNRGLVYFSGNRISVPDRKALIEACKMQ